MTRGGRNNIKFMHIIVGLGNPGKQYENTRHNAGFMAIDALAKELGLIWENGKKFKVEMAKNKDIILVKPQTFMNSSGQTTAAVLNYFLPPDKGGSKGGYPVDLADILTVIHDDLDIELGKFKVSADSRSAGHRGVESIINHLKTKNFKRLRIGIKTSALENIPPDKFVLQKFNAEELKIINAVVLAVLNETKK